MNASGKLVAPMDAASRTRMECPHCARLTCGNVLLQRDIYIFFKAVHQLWVACGQYSELSMEDVKDEIIDIIKPADPMKITMQDLMVSNCLISIIVYVLVDALQTHGLNVPSYDTTQSYRGVLQALVVTFERHA